jgi:hypothetical protein
LINNDFSVERESEETSVKQHCVSNATRIISKTKKMSWEYSKTKYVTRCDKEFQRILLHKCTAFMHLINLTASLLHKRCKKSLTTAKLKSLFLQFASETGFTHP